MKQFYGVVSHETCLESGQQTKLTLDSLFSSASLSHLLYGRFTFFFFFLTSLSLHEAEVGETLGLRGLMFSTKISHVEVPKIQDTSYEEQ